MKGLIPPQDVSLEQAVLGAVMLEKDALVRAGSEIRPDYFYKESHVVIAQAVLGLFGSGEAVDLLTVTTELRKMGKLEVAGGASYLTELTSKVASAAHLEAHIKVIQEHYLRREMIRLASEIQRKAYQDIEDVFELMDQSQVMLINLTGRMSSKQAISLKQSTMEAFRDMEKNMALKHNQELTGIPTPIQRLNNFTGGWQNGDLVILAARPAMGKTALALAFARAAAKGGKATLIFSLEMSHQKLTYRLIAQETKIKTVTEMQRGDLTQAELNAMTIATSRMTNYKINIDDQAGMSLMALRSKANRMKMKGELDMIVVDYLQLMEGAGKNNTNREQEIAMISRGLKVLAKDLDVPVIALSQLSRAVETRGGNKIPQLSDLRESGAIEQDADMVIFLYRPEYYGIAEMDFDYLGTVGTKGLAIGSIAKHRNGATGDFLMTFDSMHVDFMDYQSTPIDSVGEVFKMPSGEKNF